MKKLVFIVLMFVSLILIAEETNPEGTNWISYDGWVTGPGATGNNKYVYLLPFMFEKEIFQPFYQHYFHVDEHPILYETDMGWPVPNEDETELKYLFFGDTYFFMRDYNHNGCVMSKVTGFINNELLNFNISEPDNNWNLCNTNEPAEIAIENNFSFARTHSLAICSRDNPGNCFNPANYQSCAIFCQSNPYVRYYLDFFENDQTEQCRQFCIFDMVDTHTSRGYFLYDGNDSPEDINGKVYNNGTSNIFLAAELDDAEGTGNESKYKINFVNAQPEGSDLNSAQVHSTTDNRKSKSIWMNALERDLAGQVGIYPRGYFYVCRGKSGDPCPEGPNKLFVPYNSTSWNFFSPAVFGENYRNYWGIGDTAQFIISGSDFDQEFKLQSQDLGVGIYDFENECRIRFSKDRDVLYTFPYSFQSCSTDNIPDSCYPEERNYRNKHMLWPLFSKMSNVTVIHGLDLDILSPNDNQKYIYFMGIGETEIDSSLFYLIRTLNPLNNTYFYDINIQDGYTTEDIIKKTQKVYVARVPAYEKEIMCPASYEYFTGITNGISRWSNKMEDAEPLYSFYPLQAMVAESIVKHRDLYWMTAPLNETTDSVLGENKKGFVVLASPDALHWQKVDTILLDNPDSIWVDYAFFWLPPNLIKTGDNTMPFLYSIWKKNETDDMRNFVATGMVNEEHDLRVTLSSFLDSNWNPKFTHYNLKSGKYKFMEENATRAFLVNSDRYGLSLLNTIAGTISKEAVSIPIFTFSTGIIPLPFITFQNLDNLKNKNLSIWERILLENLLKNRYVIIEYCYCRDQNKDYCKSEEGLCPVYQNFVTRNNGNGEGNWKIIDINENQFFEDHVKNCKNGRTDDPDYMCNIPFEHKKNSPEGQKNVPIWNWKKQIKEDLGEDLSVSLSNVILRFSHWRDLEFIPDNYTEINEQLMENNKLIPYDCDGTGSSEIIATCHDSNSWRTTEFITLKYKLPFDFFEIDSDKLRLEYLYPYPVMIHDYGKPGDPAPDIWDMLTADHFAKEFFKVSSFEYADSSLRTLTSGAAATAVVKNGQMQIYAWGGTASLIPRSTSLAGILYVGTYNPETEVVTFISEILDETDTNSPALTAGASMVYDDENDKIYLIGAVDQNGISRIYRLEDARTGRKWESVATIDLGRYFRLVKKSEHEYFAFGGQTGETSFNTKVYLLDLNNMTSPQLITNIPTSGLANSFAAYSEMDQKLYIFGGQDSNGATDRFLSFDTKTAAWSEINVSGGPGAGYGGVILVDYITETISLGGGVFENSKDRQFKWVFNPKDMTWTKEVKSGSYCLKETGTTLQGGLEFSGECVPFTHPWYNSFSAGATVYSLDGKGNRLYVGTNNAIKVYDISDPTSPVLVSSFSTSSRVNDIEVYGDSLFAATNGGLYKLDASNDTLTQTLFVSTVLNNQYKVEVYNGKLYVGEDNGIKVRDLDTLSVLTSVNNGSVLDFAIENGEIGLYKDALFSPVEIRDAETLTLKANEFFGCFEIEVGSSDGRFYLSCDDEIYKFEDDGDGGISFIELSGDIRELQDVYTFDRYTYFYDENTIRISTSSDVPAICGNGIVEGDEVCDGGQIDCSELDSNYVSGTATCNSTCDGYNTNNCSDDGW